MRPKRIALAYLHPGIVRAEFMDSVIRTYGYYSPKEIEFIRVASRSSADITRKRNDVFKAVAEMDVDYLWWLDTDMCFEPVTILRLMEDDLPIVAGLSMVRSETGADRPAFTMRSPEGDLVRGSGAHLRAAGKRPFEVAAVGMACTLIAKSVIEWMYAVGSDAPLWPYAEELTRIKAGEPMVPTEDDVTFCLRAYKAGFPTFVDPRITVGHVKDEILWP